MYKVFLVDDEYRIIERIINIESWEDSFYTFCGEAADGELALGLINEIKPDIVITDIEMPFMNGLELASILKSTMPWVKVILLSGHDEFRYAKEALRIGVSDYLLKPVRIEELKLVLDKVAQNIEEEKEKSLIEAQLNHRLENISILKKDSLFEMLLSGHFQLKDILDAYNSYDIEILAKHYVVLDIKIHNHSNQEEHQGSLAVEYVQIRNIGINQLNQLRNLLWYYRTNERMIILLLGNDSLELKERAFSIAGAMKYAINQLEGHVATIGIGSIVDRLKHVCDSYHKANKARTYLGDLYQGQIIYIDDIEKNRLNPTVTGNSESYHLSRISYEDIDHYIEQVVNLEDNNSALIQYYQIMNTIIECSNIIIELGGDPKIVLPPINEQEIVHLFATKKDELEKLIRKFIESMILFRDNQDDNRYGAMIKKAQEFIKTNYSEPSISLNVVANEVNLSPNHFSMIFSNETNHTFIEYLTKVRISKAKELLETTTDKLANIGYAIGYNEPQYFSFIFKKHTGLSPRDYRDQLTNK